MFFLDRPSYDDYVTECTAVHYLKSSCVTVKSLYFRRTDLSNLFVKLVQIDIWYVYRGARTPTSIIRQFIFKCC